MKNTFEQQRPLHKLAIESGRARSIGLLDGKIGAAVLFYEHGKRANVKASTDLGGHLLDVVWTQIHEKTPIDFTQGLCGIGWATEYLIQKGFVDGVGTEICEDIDIKIMEMDPTRMPDHSLDTGLLGILHYVLMHVKGSIEKAVALPFDDKYYHDIHQTINAIPKDKIDADFANLISIYNDFYQNPKECKYSIDISHFLNMADDATKREKGEGKDKSKSTSIGLRNNVSQDYFSQLLKSN